MSDLRQGVSPSVHAILDMADRFRPDNRSSWESDLVRAGQNVTIARGGALTNRRHAALTAAALLVLAIEKLDREIAE